ncbi:hypothetical protein D3Z60_18250 [Lachnospiraceae bacterium]|jgi:hypothetical protein|nr:hypothetical protein [Lachnospiraceae bacterium]
MLIKLLYGTYGAEEEGIIIAKTNKSAPFCVEEKRGRELIASGYAMEIHSMYPPENNKQAIAREEQVKSDAKDNMDSYSLQDLRKIAKEMGLSAGGNKQEILDRIKAGEEEKIPAADDALDNKDGGDNMEESLLLTPAEPEA